MYTSKEMYPKEREYLFAYFSVNGMNSAMSINTSLEHGKDLNEAFERFKNHNTYISIIAISDLTDMKDAFDVFEEDK